MDNKAFYSAFNNSASLLQQSAANFTGNMEDARALYQETAYQISRQKEAINEVERFKSWALQVMRMVFLSSLRKKNGRINTVPSSKSDSKALPYLDTILSKIEQLDEAYRVPFWNHFMGLSDQEIACLTRLSVETVQERIAMARQMLKAEFNQPAEA